MIEILLQGNLEDIWGECFSKKIEGTNVCRTKEKGELVGG